MHSIKEQLVTYPTKTQFVERISIIVGQAGGKITAQEYCDELRKRNWATDGFTPGRIGSGRYCPIQSRPGTSLPFRGKCNRLGMPDRGT